MSDDIESRLIAACVAAFEEHKTPSKEQWRYSIPADSLEFNRDLDMRKRVLNYLRERYAPEGLR